MLDTILNFLTYALIAFQIAGIIGGVIVFILAATWMQEADKRKEGHDEQKAGA